MKNETRIKFNGFVKQVAAFNGVSQAGELFTVAASNQQKMYTRMQESADFLTEANIVPVDEMRGEKVVLGFDPRTIAGRTDTNTGEREPHDHTVLGGKLYVCKQTNFDTAIGYPKLNMWANFPDFATRLRDTVIKHKALDVLMVGFNGTHAAADTDRVANPLLQDVNTGWLQHIRAQFPERVVSEITPDSAQVTVGEAGDYKTIDGLVWDAYSLIPEELREGPEKYAVIVGRHLISDRSQRLFEAAGNQPTELEAAQMVASAKQIAGLRMVVAPFMPRKSILITPISNLSIYYQEGKDRRCIVDNSKRDRIENYESSNIAYVVEDFEKVALVDNVNRLAISDWNDDAAYTWSIPG